MSRLEAALIVFGILFIVIFIIDYVFVNRKYYQRIIGNSKKKKKNKELIEIAYLVGKFNLDKNKLNMKILLLIIAIINALIISSVSVVIILIRINIVLQLLIGLVLLLGLIYSIYEILGRILVKKGYGK